MTMTSINQTNCDDAAAKAQDVANDDAPVAQQPLSGTLVVRSSAYGSGASAASPDIVCNVRRQH